MPSIAVAPSPVATPIPVPLETKEAITAYIVQEAQNSGVSPVVALYIAEHESQFNTSARGDLEPMRDGIPAYARGTWQITRKYHPNVPDECADDVRCSTKYALALMKTKESCEVYFTTCRKYYRENT